jgi:hypothetical protein
MDKLFFFLFSKFINIGLFLPQECKTMNLEPTWAWSFDSGKWIKIMDEN